MPVGSTFDSLAAAGPAQAPVPDSPPAGGNMSNDHKLEAAKTNPIQQARIAEAAAREAVKSLALQHAQVRHGL